MNTPLPDPLARLSEATRAQIEAAEANLSELQRTVTQRDWLIITRTLDHTRAAIIEDGGLRLLALAWVKEKNAHGGASWDVLLDKTDEELLALHGFPTDDAAADAAADVESALEGRPEAGDPGRP